MRVHLQLHAYVLSVFADVVQGGDGRLHMAAVFPINQQPGGEGETRYY